MSKLSYKYTIATKHTEKPIALIKRKEHSTPFESLYSIRQTTAGLIQSLRTVSMTNYTMNIIKHLEALCFWCTVYYMYFIDRYI